MYLIKLATTACLLSGFSAAIPVKRQQAVQTYQQIANTTVDTIVNDFRTNGDVTVLRGLIDIAFAALESEAAIVSSCLLATSTSSSNSAPTSTPATTGFPLSSMTLAPGPVVNPLTSPGGLNALTAGVSTNTPFNAASSPTSLLNAVSSAATTSSTPAAVAAAASAPSASAPASQLNSALNNIGLSAGSSSPSSMLAGMTLPSTLSTVSLGLPFNSANLSGSLGSNTLRTSNVVGSNGVSGSSAATNLLATSGAGLLSANVAGVGVGAGSGGSSTTCTDLICLGATASSLLTLNAGILPTSGAALTNLANVGLGLLGGSSQPASAQALVTSALGAVSGLVISATNGAVATCTDLVCLEASLPGLLSLSGGVLPTSGAGLDNLVNVGVGILGGGTGTATSESAAITTPILALVSAASAVSSAAAGCTDLVCLQASLPGLISVSAGALPTSGANLGNILGVGLKLFNAGVTPSTTSMVGTAAATSLSTLSLPTTTAVISQVATSVSVAAASGATGAAATGSWIPVTSWVYVGGL